MTNPNWLPPAPDLFGPLIGADDIRDALKATIQTWTPTYLTELSLRQGRPLLPFEDYTLRPEYRTLPINSSPAALVTCPGTAPTLPQQHGDGSVRCDWIGEVSVVVWGTDWEPTSDLCALYAKAVRLAVVQHRSLGGVAANTKWLGEKYGEVEHSSTRTLGVTLLRFLITVDDVMNVNAGPSVVPAAGTSPSANPTVHGTAIQVTKTPITRSV